MSMDIKRTRNTATYRERHPDFTPSAIYINQEPVWAEISRQNVDLSTMYVTSQVKEMEVSWHVWFAWSTDDPEATEFRQIEPLSDDGELPIRFTSYSEALRVAAACATARTS